MDSNNAKALDEAPSEDRNNRNKENNSNNIDKISNSYNNGSNNLHADTLHSSSNSHSLSSGCVNLNSLTAKYQFSFSIEGTIKIWQMKLLTNISLKHQQRIHCVCYHEIMSNNNKNHLLPKTNKTYTQDSYARSRRT
jgi:hypothetical protein